MVALYWLFLVFYLVVTLFLRDDYLYEYVEIRMLEGMSRFIDRTQKCTQIPGLVMRQIVALER